MTRPLGLSTVRRWDRTMRTIAVPKPIKTKTYAPFLRVLLWFLVAVGVLSIGAGLTQHVQQTKPEALPGASLEVQEAFARGLAQGRNQQPKPANCDWRAFLKNKEKPNE